MEGPSQINLVIDANIILSCFSENSFTRKLILYENAVGLFAPDFLKFEYFEKRSEVLSKSKLGESELALIENSLFRKIRFFGPKELRNFEELAKRISPDPDDFRYFELALALNIPIWSNDLALKKQIRVRVLTTSEIVQLHF
ncbi:hypothetical protein HY989_04010 [Candidatus Micrarchaeota archaeon]|nr:hypothetical protein [Candidatus Micrarchaeota archaeon]